MNNLEIIIKIYFAPCSVLSPETLCLLTLISANKPLAIVIDLSLLACHDQYYQTQIGARKFQLDRWLFCQFYHA